MHSCHLGKSIFQVLRVSSLRGGSACFLFWESGVACDLSLTVSQPAAGGYIATTTITPTLTLDSLDSQGITVCTSVVWAQRVLTQISLLTKSSSEIRKAWRIFLREHLVDMTQTQSPADTSRPQQNNCQPWSGPHSNPRKP